MDSFIEVYKAISHCVSMGFMSIIIIGVNNAPKWWPKCNPFHCESMPKNVKKFIEYHRDFYDKIHSNYSNERKKL